MESAIAQGGLYLHIDDMDIIWCMNIIGRPLYEVTIHNSTRRLIFEKLWIPPLCINVHRPYLKGWQFSLLIMTASVRSRPDDAARTWAKITSEETWSPIFLKLSFDLWNYSRLKTWINSNWTENVIVTRQGSWIWSSRNLWTILLGLNDTKPHQSHPR